MSGGRSSSWIPHELRWLSKQIRPHFHWHLASFLCITAGSLLALLTPLVLKWLIDQIIPAAADRACCCVAVCLIFLGYQGKTALTSLGNYLMLTAAQKMGLSLRMSLLRHLDTLSADYYENTPVGTVIYPFKEPIDEVSYFGSDLLPAILRTLLTTCFTLTTMFLLSPALTSPFFLWSPSFSSPGSISGGDSQSIPPIPSRPIGLWNEFLEEHLSFRDSHTALGTAESARERRAFRRLARSELRSPTPAVPNRRLVYRVHFLSGCSWLMSAVIGYGGWRFSPEP